MSATLDSVALRRLVMLSILSWFAGALLSGAWGGWMWIVTLFGIALSVYFGHLLFRRVQCSLLELFAVMLLLATSVGLLVSAPGILRAPAVLAVLIPLLISWIFYAAIRATVSAAFLKIESAAARLAWIFLHAILLLSPACMLAGSIILIGAVMPWMRGSEFTPFGVPLIVSGGIGVIADFLLGMRIKRAARVSLAGASYANAVAAIKISPL